MHPILFHIGTFPVGTYGLILTIGFFLALTLAQRLGRKDGIPGRTSPIWPSRCCWRASSGPSCS